MESISMSTNVDSVICNCGKSLEFTLSLDSYNDLLIAVEEHQCSQEQ